MKGQSGDFAILILIIVIIVAAVMALAWALPQYGVYARELNGQAELKEAEWNKQILVEEAQANLDAEKLNRLAEVERAKGVAEAQAIIDKTLTPAYLQYLWINGLHDGSSEIIYVPTEVNLPILEATRLGG